MSADMKAQRDQAYNERNRCVAVIARMAVDAGCAAWIGQHTSDPRESADNPWDPEWMNIVFVDLYPLMPGSASQVSWHIHDSDLPLYSFLPRDDEPWDGHSTEEKYARLDSFARRQRA